MLAILNVKAAAGKSVLFVCVCLLGCVPLMVGQACLTPDPDAPMVLAEPVPADGGETVATPVSPPTPISPPPEVCSEGMAPTVNNPDFCCPEALPYLDGIVCVTGPAADDGDGCPAGSSPALNNPAVCCPDDFPYHTGSLCTADPDAGL